MQPVHEMPVVIKIIAQLLYDDNNLLIIIAYFWVCMVVSSEHLKDPSSKGTSM